MREGLEKEAEAQADDSTTDRVEFRSFSDAIGCTDRSVFVCKEGC